jgi:hypothetical protein
MYSIFNLTLKLFINYYLKQIGQRTAPATLSLLISVALNPFFSSAALVKTLFRKNHSIAQRTTIHHW